MLLSGRLLGLVVGGWWFFLDAGSQWDMICGVGIRGLVGHCLYQIKIGLSTYGVKFFVFFLNGLFTRYLRLCIFLHAV